MGICGYILRRREPIGVGGYRGGFAMTQAAPVYSIMKGSTVVATAKGAKAARRKADRLDAQYGASCHWIKQAL